VVRGWVPRSEWCNIVISVAGPAPRPRTRRLSGKPPRTPGFLQSEDQEGDDNEEKNEEDYEEGEDCVVFTPPAGQHGQKL